MHTISLVTICKDCSDTFSETLDSLIQNIQYLLDYVIFEGDSISSVKNKVMDHQIFQSQKVKYFREVDNGLYDALNKAINKTRGDYVLIVHGNDQLLPLVIKLLSQEINENPDFDIYYGDSYYYDFSCNITKLIKSVCIEELGKIRSMEVVHSSMLVKRELYNQLKYNTNLSIASDYEFLLRSINMGVRFRHTGIVTHLITSIGVSNINPFASVYEVLRINLNLNKGEKGKSFALFFFAAANEALKLLSKKIPLLYCAIIKFKNSSHSLTNEN